MVGIICLPLDGIGLKCLTKLGGDHSVLMSPCSQANLVKHIRRSFKCNVQFFQRYGNFQGLCYQQTHVCSKFLLNYMMFNFSYQHHLIQLQLRVRKVMIGHVTCSGHNQARKSKENCYSFSILLWFALWHHFLWKK